MKNLIKILFFGFVGGVAGAYFSIALTGNFYGNLSAAGTQIQPSPTPIFTTPLPGTWQNIVNDVSQKTVAIQVFQNNKIVRQGSGLMVSSDGLVVTVSDLSAVQAVYQIFYDDKIVKGVPALIDYGLNLMILKTDASVSGVADLRGAEHASGEEVALIGRVVNLSKPVIFSQPGWISFVSDKIISIDSAYNANLIGTVSANINGHIIGLNRVKSGKIDLIQNSVIADFLKKYLEKGTK